MFNKNGVENVLLRSNELMQMFCITMYTLNHIWFDPGGTLKNFMNGVKSVFMKRVKKVWLSFPFYKILENVLLHIFIISSFYSEVCLIQPA